MIDKSQYNESKPLDMHHLQFDIAAERLPLEPWVTEKIKSARQRKVTALKLSQPACLTATFIEFFRDLIVYS
jgi:hypothetical protein